MVGQAIHDYPAVGLSRFRHPAVVVQAESGLSFQRQ